MYNYINGIISDIENNYIVVECNNLGFQIYVANPYSYELGEMSKIYVYNNIKEDEYSLYGFKTKEDKEFFLKLINVKGLGPKMALPLFATGSIDGIKDAILRDNVIYLTKYPKIGDKLARQIILDLKNKIDQPINIDKINYNEDLSNALLSLGYKMPDIKKVIPSVNPSDSLQDQIKFALKLLLK